MNSVKQENKFYRTSTAWKMSSCIAYTLTLPSLVYASCKVVYDSLLLQACQQFSS